MNQLVKDLYFQAVKWCEENAQGAPVAWEFEEKFAELVARHCIITIQQKIVRNGQLTPENIRSKMHVDDIAKKFEIVLPLEYTSEDFNYE